MSNPNHPEATTRARRGARGLPLDDRRLEFEVALRDVDRLMMQVLQTSLSLIGFGFTMNAYFNDVAKRSSDVDANLMARRIGLALLALGLVFLAMGLWSQLNYRHAITLRYGAARGSGALAEAAAGSPPFLASLVLLVIGLGALVSILIRKVT